MCVYGCMGVCVRVCVRKCVCVCVCAFGDREEKMCELARKTVTESGKSECGFVFVFERACIFLHVSAIAKSGCL